MAERSPFWQHGEDFLPLCVCMLGWETPEWMGVLLNKKLWVAGSGMGWRVFCQEQGASKMRKAKSRMIRGLCGVGLLLLVGCQPSVAPEPSLPRLSKAELLRTSVLALLPQVSSHQAGTLRVDLEGTQRIQVVWGQGKAQQIFTIMKQGKQWWVSRQPKEQETEVMLMDTKEIHAVLGAFGGLQKTRCREETPSAKADTTKKKPTLAKGSQKNRSSGGAGSAEREEDGCSGSLGFDPERSLMQVSFWGPHDRFLLRAMKTPEETTFAAVHKGEWVLFRDGQLFEQPPRRSIDRHIGALRSTLHQISRKKGWLSIPAEWGMTDLAGAIEIGKQIEEHKKRLVPCFRKMQFPSSLGALSLSLRLYPDGKVGIRRHTSPAHIKANAKLYWCLCWRLKQWKVKPFSLPYADLQLRVPANGF